MINIHVRSITDELTSLVKQIDKLADAASPAGSPGNKHAFVVFLTEDEDTLKPKLEELAKKNKIKNTPLTIFDRKSGPKRYKIAKDAEVTIMFWKNRKVTENFAFAKGKLDAKAIKKIVAAAEKHLK